MAKRMVDCNNWVRTFEVTEPTRHRKGFTVYKVTSVVFPKSFPESATKITVWKRYSDFRKLHKELELIFKQLYLKGEFPVFPKAKVFGRFEHEVVEERRKAALILLEFTANHIQLFTSKSFMQFFENGYSSKDFIGKILFNSKVDSSQDPPATVLQEKSEINTPCLSPEILWDANENHSNEGDTLSLSPSSVSSSISPTESPKSTLVTKCDEPGPSSFSSVGNNLVNNSLNNESNTVGIPEAEAQEGEECRSSRSAIQDSSLDAKNIYSACSSQNHEDLESKTFHTNSTSRANGIVRSATVTDELSSYFNEEFEDAAFLFPTGSCSSLDTLPGFTPSSDVVDSTKKETHSSKRGLFTLPRRKTSGFGFFDFLPLFPKKSSSKKAKVKNLEGEAQEQEQKEIVKKTSLSVGYICEAAGHFAVAQFHESNTDYENAFNAYKEGIRVLLAGAQDDTDRDRKLLAKNKLEKYLARAESLKEAFLSPGMSTSGAVSPVFSSPNKKDKFLSDLTRFGKNAYQQSGKHLLSSLDDLKPYKVIGVGPTNSKILIVMNPEEVSPKCYATKVLWKSPCVIYPDKPTVIPCHIPFMVKLLKWFNTQEKIILLLEYAGGGRLEEFVKNYQSKRLSLSSPPEGICSVEGSETGAFVNQCELLVTNQKETTTNVMDSRNYLHSATEVPASINENLKVVESEKLPEIYSEADRGADTEVSSENEVFSTPAPSPAEQEQEVPNSEMDVLDIKKLLENSKALLQTVSKTLEEGSSPKKIPICRILKNEFVEGASSVQSSESVIPDKKPSSVEHVNECKSSTALNQLGGRKNSNIVEEDFDDVIPKRMVPEGVIRVWASEIVIALEALHDMGITYGDLHLNDILLGENGHILLRYKGLWTEIDDKIVWSSYAAPEMRDFASPPWKAHPSADWWSLGAILYFLLTGQSLHASHPEGFYPEMIVKVPDTSVCDTPISKSAQTLMKELLQYSPEIRLGYYGAAEIKTHPFFEGVDWEKAIYDCMNEDEIQSCTT